MTRPPPVRIVHAATAVRGALQTLTRRMVPPEVALLELASGFMATHVLYAVVRLGIADLLADGPSRAEEVAREIDASPDATRRLLRAGGAVGVFREGPDERFELTSLGRPLRSGTPGSIRSVLLMLGNPGYQAAWSQLTPTVTTGTPGAEHALGMPIWDYLDHDPEFAEAFNDAMSTLSALDWPAVEAVYDFTTFTRIVDVGGGHGQLLARMLGTAPAAQGVLLERDAVLSDAEAQLRTAGVLARCRVEAGSFFDTAPADGDLYVLRRVIHDFDDEQAAAILSNVRSHMPADATLLVMESVVPPGNTPHFAKLLDLDIMLFTGGRERTEKQFATLLARAGFDLARVIPTASTLSLLEARPRKQP